MARKKRPWKPGERKLSDAEVDEIIDIRAPMGNTRVPAEHPNSLASLATKYKVSVAAISCAANGLTYKRRKKRQKSQREPDQPAAE